MSGVRPPWHGSVVRVGSRRLFVRAAPATSGAAEPAVYVHGLGGSSTNWTDLMGLLADRLDGLAPDLPGFGFSPPPDDGSYSPRSHARAVVDLVEHTGRGPVHLLANSLGGAVCTLLAADRPDLVRTLTLVAPALPVLLPRRTNVHLPLVATPLLGPWLAARLAAIPVERRVQATLNLCYGDPAAVPPQRRAEAEAEALRRDRLPYAGDALLGSLRGLLVAYLGVGGDTLWRAAARVQAPTLLVYGARDKLVGVRSAPRATRTFPDSRLVVLPDGGHVAQMEHPEVVDREVRTLLDTVAARERVAREQPAAREG